MIRVTESIDFFKPEWYADWLLKVGRREANAVSKKAQKIGHRIDEIIRSGVYEAQKKDTQEVKQSLKNFIAWKERYNIQVIEPLERRNAETIDLTGQADFYLPEIETLIDFKSSKRIYPEYFFQLGGYKRLGFVGKKLAVLRCDKDLDEFEFKTNEDLGLTLEQCVDAFESAFKHYKYYTYIHTQLEGEDERNNTDGQGVIP
jgi:hypothetical protein